MQVDPNRRPPMSNSIQRSESANVAGYSFVELESRARYNPHSAEGGLAMGDSGRAQKGPRSTILAWMLGFGILVGGLFPFWAMLFVDFRPGMFLPFMGSCIAAGLMIGTANSIIMRRGLVKPLRGLSQEIQIMAAGDLRTRPRQPVQAELAALGAEVERLREGFRDLIRQTVQGSQAVSVQAQRLTAMAGAVADAGRAMEQIAEEVARGDATQSRLANESRRVMEELHQAILQISAGAQGLAESATRTAGSAQRLQQTTESVTGKASQVRGASAEALGRARESNEVVRQQVTAMNEMRQVAHTAAGKIHALGDLSSQIGTITGVIAELAEQTNLLALNAAIEAARAGEQGRGFAVVADEVRKLAERSGRSASDIASLVAKVQVSTAESVVQIEQVTAKTEEATSLASEVDRALNAILHTLEDSAADANAIGQAADELARVGAEVGRLVSNVAASAEENMAATEEMAAGSETVANTVSEMSSISSQTAQATQTVRTSVAQLDAAVGTLKELARATATLEHQVSRFQVD